MLEYYKESYNKVDIFTIVKLAVDILLLYKEDIYDKTFISGSFSKAQENKEVYESFISFVSENQQNIINFSKTMETDNKILCENNGIFDILSNISNKTEYYYSIVCSLN